MMLERRGFLCCGLTGFVVGLVVAWLLWREVPAAPERDMPRVAAVAVAPHEGTAAADVLPAEQPDPEAAPASEVERIPVDELDIAAAKVQGGILVQDLDGGRRVELTLQPKIQERADHILRRADVPYGALVAMEPSTGRILAYSEHSSERPGLRGLPVMANPPAASIFKVVTAAALLEHARLSPDTEVRYHGGARGIGLRHLEDHPKLDTGSHTLAEALGLSTNAVFGKLAYRHLDAETLERYAHRFGFGQEIPFVFPVEQSRATFSDDRVRLARIAAGFYDTQLSPLHGALIAGAIANDGLMVAPVLVERYLVSGKERIGRTVTPLRRAVGQRTARLLANMMVTTTEMGTAAPYFRKRGPSLAGIRVAGKTGSLSAEDAEGVRHHFSWWVGFAPAESPRVAVSALVVNTDKWHIKSTYLAREILETYFEVVTGEEVTSTAALK